MPSISTCVNNVYLFTLCLLIGYCRMARCYSHLNIPPEVYFDDKKTEVHFVEGQVGPANYSRYTIQTSGFAVILLDSIQGDADLYVSTKIKEPTYLLNGHELQSATCGIDRVDVPFAKGIGTRVRDIHIAVYGHPSKELTRFNMLLLIVDRPDSREGVEYFQVPNIPIDLVYQLRDNDEQPPDAVTIKKRSNPLGGLASFLATVVKVIFEILLDVMV